MKITAEFTNRTSGLEFGNPVTVEAPQEQLETIFRRLLYTYGEVIDTEKIDSKTKRYTLLTKLQYHDTLESYELETSVTIAK